MPNTPDPTAVIYDALEGLQGTTYHLPPGTRQAVAEHLARVLPAVPSAAASPTQAALRDRIAEALAAKFTRDGGVTEGMRVLDDSDLPVPRRPRPTEVADAVLAVLPEPTDRYPTAWRSARSRAQAYGEGILLHVAQRDFWQMAAEQNYAAGEAHRLALSEALGLGTGAPWDAIREQAAAVPSAAETTNRAALSDADRQFLTFALDLAFDRMVSDDGFTDEDEAALEKLRRLAAEEQPAETQDSLPCWLYQRFMPDGVGWENLDADDRSYWEHHARAVRRAVARGGFKAERPAVAEQPDTQTREAVEPPRVVRCSRAILSRPHEPHGWLPQPGMDPVDCPGHSFTEDAAP